MSSTLNNVKVGDIFYTSWGYDQTNVNFFQVVELKGKSSVIIQEIDAFHGYESIDTGRTTPCKDDFLDTSIALGQENRKNYAKKRVLTPSWSNGEPVLRIRNHYAKKVEPGRSYYFSIYS